MFLNAFRIRLAMMGAGLLTLCIYLSMGGRLGPNHHGVIAIEFGAYPDEFEGLEVVLDGKPVGVLKHVGGMYRSGFEVPAGEHQVRVVSPRFSCQPLQLTIADGQHRMLMLDYAETLAGSESVKPQLYFH